MKGAPRPDTRPFFAVRSRMKLAEPLQVYLGRVRCTAAKKWPRAPQIAGKLAIDTATLALFERASPGHHLEQRLDV